MRLPCKELCSKFTLCTWIITTVITFIEKSCNYLSFIRFIEGQICVTKLRCILYMYHNNFALGAKKYRYKLVGFLQIFFEEVECWSVLDTGRNYRLKASYTRPSLESKLIHLIHRVLFASQTASVIQSLLKSAPDFVKRLSLLFFFTQKRCVIVKRTDVKYITFRS